MHNTVVTPFLMRVICCSSSSRRFSSILITHGFFTSGSGSWCLTYVPLGGGASPLKKLQGVKNSPNLSIFRLFCPFLQNGARYRQSKNGFVICGHSSTRWWSIQHELRQPNSKTPTLRFIQTGLARGEGSHSLQIFTSGSGSWCLTYLPLGGPSPTKIFWGAKFFPTS